MIIRLLVLAAVSAGAQTLIEPRIVSETLPAGGLMQIKLDLTSPHPITTSGADFAMDAAFDGVEGVAMLSPGGDGYGVAVVQGQSFRSNLVSPLASLGTQLDYPFLMIATKMKAGLAAGTKIPINFGATTFFIGPGGAAYAMPAAKNGVLTIGGSVSVTNVVPGGGLLPAGTVVRLLGTGFAADTRVDLGNATVSRTTYVNPTEIQLTLGAATNMTGQRIRVKNKDNSEATYYSYLRAVALGTSTRPLLNACHPLFSDQTSTSAGLVLPAAPANGFVAVALRNMALTAVMAQLDLVSSAGAALGTANVSLPGGSQFLRTAQELFGTSPAGATVRLTAGGALQVLGLRGDESSGTVTAFLPGTAPVVVSELTVTPGPLVFDAVAGGTAPAGKSIGVASTGTALSYTVGSNAAWLTVTPATATTPGSHSVSVNPAGMAAGTYTGSITVTPPAGSAARTVVVTLNIAGGAQLTVSPGSLVFDGPGAKTLAVGSTGAALPFVAATSAAWLTATPSSGQTPATVAVTANAAGLAAGSYSGQVTFTANGAATLTVPVSLTVAATGQILVTPASLVFDGAGSRNLSVTSTGGTIPFAVGTGAAWLTAAPSSGQTPATVAVTASVAGLAAGQYTTTLTIGGQSVFVTLNVATAPPAPPLRLSPGALQFVYAAGGPLPASQEVRVDTGAVATGFTLTTSANWLMARASQASTPATLTVSVSPQGLASGRYSGTVEVLSATGGRDVLAATLVVGASSGPEVGAIVNGASQAAGTPLAPGQIVTIYGAGLGPVTGQGPILLGTRTVETLNGGTRVWFGSTPAPILYTSAGQVNVMVPYEAFGTIRLEVEYQGRRSAARDVTVVAAAPAIFTQDASGRGRAAVLNQDYTLNTPARRAVRGSVIMIYGTGGGQTSPASITGEIAGPDPRTAAAPVAVTIGGRRVEALYAGVAPGLVTGLMQVNVMIPVDVTPGDAVPITIAVGGVVSPEGTTISIE